MIKAYLDELYEMKFAVQSEIKQNEKVQVFQAETSDYDVHMERLIQLRKHLSTIDLFINRYFVHHSVASK